AIGASCMAVIDGDVNKHGKKLYDVPIVSRDFMKNYDKDFYLIVSVASGEDIANSFEGTYKVLPLKMADYIIRLSYLNCEEYGFSDIENIGSYMSPYPDATNYNVDVPIYDIDFNMEKQEKIFEYLVNLYKEIDKVNMKVERRFYEDNTKYGEIDALVLHGILLLVVPRRIIEIGSGFSTAVMLDTNEYCMDNRVQMEFIEPYPQRLNSLLRKDDNIKLQEVFLQDVDMSTFDKLETGDILFVDSSHMAKMGSDVNKIFFNILPRLKSGVYVHFHDIFKDFEYPIEWIEFGRVWNECYLLRTFLMNNNDYEIIFFCDMWNEQFEKTGLFDKFVGGANIWLRKK
ncbi:class I SAM-dependent methyltransferase, partial [Lachnoclostridium sp.]|uniref:class I SAM-dependent methyltransferase n=1 Tax=Lachnoclostridium sp. TaxID=2028282 RepID=UPI00289A2DEF